MTPLEYKTEISASSEKIWDALCNKESYTEWSGGNRYEGNWTEGTEMKFLDPKNNGMYNLVERHTPDRELTMKHLGWIYDGNSDPQDWTDSRISYLLQPNDFVSELTVKVNSLDEFVDFYNGYIPKILQKIKEIAER